MQLRPASAKKKKKKKKTQNPPEEVEHWRVRGPDLAVLLLMLALLCTCFFHVSGLFPPPFLSHPLFLVTLVPELSLVEMWVHSQDQQLALQDCLIIGLFLNVLFSLFKFIK